MGQGDQTTQGDREAQGARAALTACTEWIAAFNAALARRDASALTALFVADSHWRDLVAFVPDLTTVSGTDAIATRWREVLAHDAPGAFRLASGKTAPHPAIRAGVAVVEALIEFDTASGHCEGALRLVPDPSGPGGVRCWILLTALDRWRGDADGSQHRRARATDDPRNFGGENWLDKRRRACAYESHDPAVLVIGAGQAGLGIAARLTHLGIDTLIIDRAMRIGDNWRKRYHALTLHNEVHVNHLPFLPFPGTWPVFIPKDMLANWFEFYVEALELNGWAGTDLLSGHWDDTTQCWEVRLRRHDGSVRLMRPRHLVYAVGVSSIPVRPPLPGLETFAGTVLHSGEYDSGQSWRGRRALVIGSGNSGHDVMHDLHANGAAVTLVQRGPTYIVSIEEAQRVYALYDEGMPTADCDLLATAMPFPVLKQAYRLTTALSRHADRVLLQALEARGFRLGMTDDDAGFQMRYLERGGGYYFNVGASDLIAGGQVGLLQYDAIARFEPQGARLKDGSALPADLIVLATGYENPQEVVRATLGDELAQRIGKVWGFDAGGELRNMWRPVAQPGLWFTAGSLAQCRIYSKYLALQIKAQLVSTP